MNVLITTVFLYGLNTAPFQHSKNHEYSWLHQVYNDYGDRLAKDLNLDWQLEGR